MKVLASGAIVALILGVSTGSALKASIASAAVARGPQMTAEGGEPVPPPLPSPDLQAG